MGADSTERGALLGDFHIGQGMKVHWGSIAHWGDGSLPWVEGQGRADGDVGEGVRGPWD